MTILCIDYGLKRIGIAIGSTDSGIAFARDILMNDQKLFENIQEILTQDIVEKILVGMPWKRDQSPGDIDEQLQKFVAQLKKRFEFPVEMVDERYTSKMASAKLHAVEMKAKDQKKTIDSVAAQVMLQEWLDSAK